MLGIEEHYVLWLATMFSHFGHKWLCLHRGPAWQCEIEPEVLGEEVSVEEETVEESVEVEEESVEVEFLEEESLKWNLWKRLTLFKVHYRSLQSA